LKKLFNKDQEQELKRFYSNIPAPNDYIPTRPVDINAHELYNEIGENGLTIPWHVISSAATALNAEKHIIFTGPPGCGKTKIASIIGRYVSKCKPLMVTASQAWTTDEIIGRYMPNLDARGLTFKAGFFLQALEDKRWLIIDEINRCDIDNCFGELFTVLSGHSVTLPFEKEIDTAGEQENFMVSTPVRIVVGQDNGDVTHEGVYRYFDQFRLLATMNDADITGLNQLSYALRRRFAIIRVDAPSCDDRKTIFNQRRKEVFNELQLNNKIYQVRIGNGNHFSIDFNSIASVVNNLFAKIHDSDLIEDLRVVGIAPVRDIIRFAGEGLRSPDNQRSIAVNQGVRDTINQELSHSFLAMGLVLNVFPQLDAVTGEIDRFHKALICIRDAFGDNDTFWYIERDANNSLNLKSENTIREYLGNELKRQYATDPSILDEIEKVFN
jgi:MoxR-like ATPase